MSSPETTASAADPGEPGVQESGELLRVEDLAVYFETDEGTARAVDGVSFAIGHGETLGLVGESGCGKSVTALSIMRLVAQAGQIVRGRVLYDGRDLAAISRKAMRRIRGAEIAMIFQEPMSSLNPVFTIGDQIAEAVELHLGVGGREAREHAVAMLERVGIPAAKKRVDEYPHQLSGGMRQRVMIAMALSCRPKLLIADEPTTALDVTVQAQILDLLNELRTEYGMSILLITHDLGVVADVCSRAVVMYAGQVVEQGETGSLFGSPQHPYTEGLLKSIPQLGMRNEQALGLIEGRVPSPLHWPGGCRFAARCDYRFEKCAEEPPLFEVAPQESKCWLCESGRRVPKAGEFVGEQPVPERAEPRPRIPEAQAAVPAILRVEALKTHFPVGRHLFGSSDQTIKAVDGVDLELAPGETLGIVGESGCGKSTLGRSLLRLVEPTSGRVEFEGVDITALPSRALRPLRARMQIIFQDPVGSLNPRLRVGQIVGEALRVHGVESRSRRRALVLDALDRVGMGPEAVRRYPHEFSGGQRQRIGIARALVLAPKLVVADEPVSALDVSIQSQVLNLMVELKRDLDLTYIFIAHNLAVVSYMSDRVAVMYLGKIVELAAGRELYEQPLHPYTQSLLSAIPSVDLNERRERIKLVGDPPSPIDPPSGCHFRTRCPLARELGTAEGICAHEEPPLVAKKEAHVVACHFA
ncbi:MAG TPA: ABC transporter ATP-binding protein [Gaiellaceae bacterium]|nr:ABC transporter ATP-binding protein [Gaiellaceae bacterium]